VLLLLFLAAVSLMKYVGWRLIVGDDYFLYGPQAISHANRMSKLWLSGLILEEIVATVVLFLLLPRRLRLFRLLIPVLAVSLVTGMIAYVLIAVGLPALNPQVPHRGTTEKAPAFRPGMTPQSGGGFSPGLVGLRDPDRLLYAVPIPMSPFRSVIATQQGGKQP
jgi:hypothetical protein